MLCRRAVQSGGMPRAEFTGRWGFTTPSGVPKPIHRAFQLLHAAGTARLAAKAAPGDTCGSSTHVLALANSTVAAVGAGSTVAGGGAMIFVSNSGRAQCNVTLTGLTSGLSVRTTATQPTVAGRSVDSTARVSGWLHRIDPQHGNPRKVWQAQGSPPFPTMQQTVELKAASELHAHAISIPLDASKPGEGEARAAKSGFTLTVPPDGLAVLVL
jgi:hypothetical protein